MVKLIYEEVEVELQDFHLDGLAVLSGLGRRDSLDFADEVISSLEESGDYRIPFDKLIDRASTVISNHGANGAAEDFFYLGKYLSAAFKREINDPFFVFIGGAPSSGKDTLVGDLVHYLGCYSIDRIVPTDMLRESSRSEFIRAYGSEKEVPENLLPLFRALYQVGSSGIELQVEHVRKNVKTYFVDQAIRETKTWMHPIHVLFGSHVMPRFEKEVKGKNKLVVMLNPSEKGLRARIASRQEKERGPIKNDEDRRIRAQECERTLEMRKYIELEAQDYDCELINEETRTRVLQIFGKKLIRNMKGVLDDSGVLL